jgi:soluble lytic murein transglycosylase-like protein
MSTQARLAATIALALAALLGTVRVAHAEIWVYEDARGTLKFSNVPTHPGFRPLRDLDSRRVSAPASVPSVGRGERARVDPLIARAAREYGVDPGLVKAIVHVESLFDQRAISRAGAQGLMQLMPHTARDLGVDDPFNPWQNIEGGTRYLRSLMREFEGDLRLSLAAYNAGAAVVRRYGGIPPYQETRQYVDRVLRLSRRYNSDFDVDLR